MILLGWGMLRKATEAEERGAVFLTSLSVKYVLLSGAVGKQVAVEHLGALVVRSDLAALALKPLKLTTPAGWVAGRNAIIENLSMKRSQAPGLTACPILHHEDGDQTFIHLGMDGTGVAEELHVEAWHLIPSESE